VDENNDKIFIRQEEDYVYFLGNFRNSQNGSFADEEIKSEVVIEDDFY